MLAKATKCKEGFQCILWQLVVFWVPSLVTCFFTNQNFARKPANNQRDQNGSGREHIHGIRTNKARDAKTSLSVLTTDIGW